MATYAGYVPLSPTEQMFGSRLGLTTCMTCGAAVIVDESTRGAETHDRWHETQTRP